MLKTHHIVRRVASDLNALTRQNTKWKEADGLPKRSKEAFEAIKAALSSRPVMAYPKNWAIPNCLPRKKLAKKFSFLPKSSVSKTATFCSLQKNVTFCQVFTT
jgi:hypothetical protein